MEKIIKAFWSADVPLNKLNHKHMKNLFYDIGQGLPSETTRRKTVLHLSADEVQGIRNAVPHKQIFLVLDESTPSGT